MTESVENLERKLSVRELERLIFLSFLHSQGMPELQALIVAWMRREYGFQNQEDVHQAFDNLMERQFNDGVLRLSEKNHHENIEPRIEEQRAHIEDFFTETEDPSDPDFLRTVFNMIIDRDLEYIVENNGRPNRKQAGGTSIADKYFSFVVTYLKNEQPTGDPALDKLYRALKAWAQADEYDEYEEQTATQKIEHVQNEQVKRLKNHD